MEENRALAIGVSSFSSSLPAGEEPPAGVETWHPLGFVPEVMPPLVRSLRQLGYHVDALRDPDVHEMRTAVETSLGDCRVVYVVTHGATDRLGDPARVDAVPSCSTIGLGTNVSEWVSTAQTARHPTLFLLDLCRSGRAARLPGLLHHAGRDNHAWVIAAAAADEVAYDGRFSIAAAEVLDELSRTGLGTSTTRPYVAFSVVARRIRQRVETMPGIPQTVVATPLDQGLDDPLLPFFPNPRYREDPLQAVRESVGAPIRPFLDDLLHEGDWDPEHFVDRVGTHFAGRRAQLRQLSGWLDGEASHGLTVVTGDPGVGKSALLGAVVCSAHPRLVEAVPHVRARLQAQEPDGCPSVILRMAAVHARQRRLAEVVTSVADQLRLSEPPEGWGADALVEAISRLGERPVVVLDALDEAIDSTSIAKEFLVRLATATYPEKHQYEGQPICRLLVGMRPWDNLHDLHELAASQGGLIDLDDVDSAEVLADLTAHLAGSFADVPAYRPGTARKVRHVLASAIAARLIRETANASFGAFLVATIFIRSVGKLPLARTEEEALSLAESVPTTLPDLLELDLASRADPESVRAVLKTLAHAQGDGMPAEVASVLVPLFHDGPVPGLQKVMDACRFYTRTTVDVDGSSLYRLFHQGLADHLCGTSVSATASVRCPEADSIIDRLLTRGLVGRDPLTAARSWATTAPYVLRHVLNHAAVAGWEHVRGLLEDTDFLVHADPSHVLPHVRTAPGDISGVYGQAFADRRPRTPEARRFLLFMTATQRGDATVLRTLRASTGKEVWQPYRVCYLGTTVRSLALTVQDDDLVALVADSRGHVARWAVEGALRVLWSPERRPSPVGALACTIRHGRPVFVSGEVTGRLTVGELDTTALPVPSVLQGAPVGALACAQVGDRPIAVVGGLDGSVHIRRLDCETSIARIDRAHTGPVNAVACTVLAGEAVAVTAGLDGLIRLWDLVSGRPCAPSLDNGAPVGALDCVRSDGRTLAVVGGMDGTVRFWDVAEGHGVPGEPHTAAVRAVTCTDIGGSPAAVTGSRDGEIRVWDLDRCSPEDWLLLPNTVTALAAVSDTILVGLGTELLVLRKQGPRGNERRWRTWGWEFPDGQH